MRTALRSVMLGAALLGLGCPNDGPPIPHAPSALFDIASPGGSNTVAANGTLQLRATLDGDDVTERSQWASGDQGVATVTQTGLVTAVAPGSTDISATFLDNVARFPIVVTEPPASRRHRLSVSVQGSGTVTSRPPGIACGTDCSEDYEPGVSVALIPEPVAGATFTGWRGDPDCDNGAVTMDRDIACTATFTAAPTATHALMIRFEGSGSGSVTVSPPGTVCTTDCRQEYGAATMVTMTATPEAGATFDWRGDPDCDDGVVTMNTDVHCVADFSSLAAALDVPAFCEVDEPCRFSAAGSTGVAAAYRWKFGDGDERVTDEPVVAHTYAPSLVNVGALRSVTVELTVEDASDNRAVTTARVDLRNPNLEAALQHIGTAPASPGKATLTFGTSGSSRGNRQVSILDGAATVDGFPSDTTFTITADTGQTVRIRLVVSDDGSHAYPMNAGTDQISVSVPNG